MSKCEDKKNLAEYWEKEISEWKVSSLTVVEYCRIRNIGRHLQSGGRFGTILRLLWHHCLMN